MACFSLNAKTRIFSKVFLLFFYSASILPVERCYHVISHGNCGQTFVYFWYLKNYDYQEIETIILKVQTSGDHAIGLLYVVHGMILALQGLILALLDYLS